MREYLLAAQGERSALENRFREYVEKYSVYSDIVLFNNAGLIRARLASHPLVASQHEILTQARTTSAAYVEYFGKVDFLPPGNHLVYAFRVDDAQGNYLGVLALAFRLTDEMGNVFAKLLGDNDCSLLATVDADGCVVATSSPIQLPRGTRLSQNLTEASGAVVRFAGREYLAVACPAHSYQGYAGPGWIGLGLMPVEFAFERNDTALLGHVDPAVLAAVTSHPDLFSAELRKIPQQAERIQEDLNRSVWNGSVRQVDVGQQAAQGNSAFAKTLLWEISNTGRKTQAVFEQSIGNLHQTVVAALLQSGVSRAALAIDVMDRNLYERANDCRWWALNASFRRVLAAPAVSPEDTRRCSEILSYINGLYTVYDNLVLFNAQGVVIAVSKPERAALVGTRLHENWVERSLALKSSQSYVVSSFDATPLYAQRPTYIYAAAIRHPENAGVVGGIGIVFDGAAQFAAMLDDALPCDNTGAPLGNVFTLFAHRDGTIIASTTPSFVIGSHFPLEAAQRNLERGGRLSSIVALNGQYYALGVAMSAGYREYKTSDGYEDDVLALCAFPLGEVTPQAALAVRQRGVAGQQGRTRRLGSGGDLLEIATFYVGKQWLGIPAVDVVEAIDAEGITPALGGNNDLVAGVKMYRNNLISVLHLKRLIGHDSSSAEAASQIVVVRTRNKVCIGLLVDELGEIPEVARDEILPMGNVADSPGVLTIGVINGIGKAGDRHGMLSVIATDRLCQRTGCACSSEIRELLPVAKPWSMDA